MKLFLLSICYLIFSLMKMKSHFTSSLLISMFFYLNLTVFGCLGFYYMKSYFYLDCLSLLMVGLSIYVFASCSFVIPFLMVVKENLNSILLWSLLIILFFCFFSVSFFSFFFFFEFSLFPIFLMIMGWGYQSERLGAAMSMMLYTIFTSLPLLAMLIYLEMKMFSHSFFWSSSQNIYLMKGFEFSLLKLFMLTGFMVKFPMYGVHLWLPKAHVEAPVIGSIILASILLKLGGYGLFRMMLFLGPMEDSIISLIQSFSLAGGLVASFICVKQVDMKVLIAYSSVAHMSFAVASFLSSSKMAFVGGVVMLLSHGFTSSSLFYLANVVYMRSHTRSMLLMNGFLSFSPLITFWFGVCCMMNMGVPPTLNFMSEVLVIVSLINMKLVFMLVLGMMVFMAALYNFVLFNMLNHGQDTFNFFFINQMKKVEVNFLLLMNLYPFMFMLMLMYFML